jgi:hypothetical protein
MMKKNLFRLAFLLPALAGFCLMSSTPVGAPYSAGLTADDDVVKKAVVIENSEHNFGDVPENGGPVTATFTVFNGTDEAIVLTSVKASCGCTTPNWTKEPIEPGKKGEITATYNPKGRPGGFDKAVTATTNANERLTMRIKGNVVSE